MRRAMSWPAMLGRVASSAEFKATMYGALRGMVERKALVLPTEATDLRRELELLRVDLTPSGTERIEARTGHDDLPDALCQALMPYRDGARRWRSRIAALSLPGGPWRGPERPVDVADAFPRTPVWQSVAGPELWDPAGDRTEPRWMEEPRRVAAAAAVGVRDAA